MKIRQIILISFGLFLLLMVPSITEARLVPCGPGAERFDWAIGEVVTIECQFCHLFVILWKILDFLVFTIAPALTALVLVIAGFMYYQAGTGDASAEKQAKDIIISVFLAFIIFYGSLGFLTAFTEYIADIPIYSHIADIIDEDNCPVPAGFWD
jgi:hypothetical protein